MLQIKSSCKFAITNRTTLFKECKKNENIVDIVAVNT